MAHRYPATGDRRARSLVLAALADRAQRAGGGRRIAARWALATLVWVCLQGALRRAHGDDAALSGDRHRCTCSAASAPAGAARRSRPRSTRRAPLPLPPALARGLLGGGRAGVAADRARRLGQHQLRGARLQRLPDLPGQLVAGRWSFGDGFALLRAARRRRRRRLPAVRRADRDPHGASPRRPASCCRALAAARLAAARAAATPALRRWALALGGIAALADSPAASATCCSAGRWSAAVAHTAGAAALVVVLTADRSLRDAARRGCRPTAAASPGECTPASAARCALRRIAPRALSPLRRHRRAGRPPQPRLAAVAACASTTR